MVTPNPSNQRMKWNTGIVCVALCLGLTVGQMQLRVYRGTLVHSRVPEQIKVLQDYLLGFDANNLGEVSATACYLVAAVVFYFVSMQCLCDPAKGCDSPLTIAECAM